MVVSTPAIVKGASASHCKHVLYTAPPTLDAKETMEVRLHCPHDDCYNHPLTIVGLHPHVRQVLDLDGYYSLVTEHLECGNCKRKVIRWSQGFLYQLDVGRGKQFPIIITYNNACDMIVVRFAKTMWFGK